MTIKLIVLNTVTDVEDQLECIEQQGIWPAELLIFDRARARPRCPVA